MFTLACLALSACLVVDSPDDARIGALVAQLEGSDEPARSLARQLLPREGVAVVPRVVPLLGRDNASISQAAYQVLSDIAHDASAPGHEADRRAVTEQLLGLVAKSQSRSVRLMGLRLLPIVAPEGVDLGPVAALLGDPELREKARVALEEMGTTEARAALRKRLGETDPVFAIALLNALGRLGDKPSLATMRTLAGHAYPGVRSAAARALANVASRPISRAALGRRTIGSGDTPRGRRCPATPGQQAGKRPHSTRGRRRAPQRHAQKFTRSREDGRPGRARTGR
ncbi:MAG: HEAT repeat domain-containing protein [Isosphaeraceae bacterium]